MAIQFYEIPLDKGINDPMFRKFYSFFTTQFPPKETIPLKEFQYKFDMAKKPHANLTTNLIVAYDGERILGGVVGHFVKPGRVGFVEYIFVDPALRSQGIGEVLLKRFEGIMRKRYTARGIAIETDRPKSWKDPAHADVRRVKFWENQGYQRVGLAEMGGGYRSAEATTGSFHRGYVPMDLRIKFFTPPTDVRQRTLSVYRAMFAITKIWGTTRKSPKYPRSTANIAARMMVNKPLNARQAGNVTGRMVAATPRPVTTIALLRDYPLHRRRRKPRA